MMVSTAAVASTAMNRAAPGQASMVAPFTGLKSKAGFPVSRKPNNSLANLPSNGGRVSCMMVYK